MYVHSSDSDVQLNDIAIAGTWDLSSLYSNILPSNKEVLLKISPAIDGKFLDLCVLGFILFIF